MRVHISRATIDNTDFRAGTTPVHTRITFKHTYCSAVRDRKSKLRRRITLMVKRRTNEISVVKNDYIISARVSFLTAFFCGTQFHCLNA